MRTLPNFFRSDFSEHRDFLAGMGEGPLSEDEAVSLASMLGELDQYEGQGQWTAAGEGEFSLAGAEVFLISENHVDLPTNPLFSNVIGIRLSDGEDGDGRRIYLHYNQ